VNPGLTIVSQFKIEAENRSASCLNPQFFRQNHTAAD
jgi:hypothetical protein